MEHSTIIIGMAFSVVEMDDENDNQQKLYILFSIYCIR